MLPYLFGSILTVTWNDVRVDRRCSALIIVVTLLLAGRALFAIVLDEESARVAGLPVDALNTLLAALTAVTIVAAMRVVGVLLVAALMVIPVATSRLLARSFAGTIAGASAVGVASVVIGLAAARQWELAPGGSIVLTAVACFAITSVGTGLVRRAGPRPVVPGI